MLGCLRAQGCLLCFRHLERICFLIFPTSCKSICCIQQLQETTAHCQRSLEKKVPKRLSVLNTGRGGTIRVMATRLSRNISMKVQSKTEGTAPDGSTWRWIPIPAASLSNVGPGESPKSRTAWSHWPCCCKLPFWGKKIFYGLLRCGSELTAGLE